MPSNPDLSFPRRWRIFISERFKPLPHLLMLSLFFAGNCGLHNPPDLWVPRYLVLLLAFFRLRIQDDLKDLPTDRIQHPERPLPRGLVSVREARIVSFSLVALELLLVLVFLPGDWLWWLLWFGFSLLMGIEFFAGKWLASRPELYALLHTPFAMFAGWFLAGEFAWRFAPANWMAFCVFEFSRKTYGRDEEPGNGEVSYSRRLGAAKAVILSVLPLSIMFLAAGMFLGNWRLLALILPALAAGHSYVQVPISKRARVFRVTSLVSVFLMYALTAWWRG